MRVFTETVGDKGAPLTCYVLDSSDELSNTRVRPGVLVLPGGGYSFTSDREAEPIALAYLAEGFNACILRYAAGTEAPWSASFADGQAALRWMRDHADKLAIDPAKIAAVGFSAGGHLAASLGTVSDDKPNALVLGYPVTLDEFGPPVGKQIADIPSQVSADTPPTFLFSTSADGLVPVRNSLALLSALAEHDVPFETHIYLLGPHGISLAKPLTANGSAALVDAGVARWMTDSARFLHAVFGDFEVTGDAETYQTLLDRRTISLRTPIKRLLADERAAAVLERHVPGFVADISANSMAEGLALEDVARWSAERFPPDVMDAIAQEFLVLSD